MASSGKKKTTMAKLNRESKMREKRQDKLARKEARKFAAANPELAQAAELAENEDALRTDDAEVPALADA